MERTKIGIIGCGNISKIYCGIPKKFSNVEVVACADIDLERARAKAAEHGIAKALSVDDLLEDPDVEIAVNLTIPAVHAAVSKRILEAGKHVYSEKPLATNREDAVALLKLAKEKGLRVGCAPDTFLGAGLQTCRQIIDAGTIGEPVAAMGALQSRGPEGWHPDPEFFYQPGAGPMFDMGPYYLTALTSLLGPVRRVTGSARTSFPERTIGSKAKLGQKIKVNTHTHIAGVLDFAAGAVGTLITSFDVHGGAPFIEIYGSEASLAVPDPNTFGGVVGLRVPGERTFAEQPLTSPYSENVRGIGVADMAAAIRDGRPHRANADMAFHVLDLMIAFHEASATDRHVELGSAMERPAALPLDLKVGSLS